MQKIHVAKRQIRNIFLFKNLVLSNGGLENPLRSGNFILNGGRHHKRSKSNGKSSKSNSTSKFYETNTDEVGSMKNEGGRSTFFEVYENQQK